MTTPDRKLAFHGLLLGLAGRVSDGLVSQARTWLAEDRLTEAARGVAFAVSAQRMPMPGEDLALLTELAVDADLSAVRTAGDEPTPSFGFGDGPEDELDRVAVAALAGEHGALGLWRAWRYPADGAPWPPPRRVYLVEAGADVDLIGLTGRTQHRLTAAGEADPQVEAYRTAAELPPYQRLARAYGDLLWASTPAPDIRIAAIFDHVDPETGPRFADTHERVTDSSERERVAEYLRTGEPLLVTTATMDDVLDAGLPNAVPLNFRTDGTWIWTDATTYYLRRHHLAPDSGLLAHIRAMDHRMPALDGVALHRAMAALQAASDDEPAN